MQISVELSRPERYERQLDWLHKRRAGQRSRGLTHDGVRLSELIFDKRRVSRLLARAVGSGEYELSPVQPVEVTIEGRVRTLHHFEALDFVVHGVIGDLLAEAMEPHLSPDLYSYRRRYSAWQAVRKFARWIRAQRRHEPADPRRRGLHVFRGDVRKYADTIPVTAPSPLWRQLNDVLAIAPGDRHWPLVEGIVRPELHLEDGSARTRTRGLPLGSPAVTILLNLYLDPLDHLLDSVPGAFYVRFGDDILFAHRDATVVADAAQRTDALLDRRGLALNPSKRRLLYFNGAGRSAAGWEGARHVAFLGAQVEWDGTVSMPTHKWRALLRDLEERARSVRALVATADEDARGASVCAVLNEALDPASPLAATSGVLVRKLLTDRRQLAQLDYHVARIAAAAVTGDRSPRAFRQLPYRRLRNDYGLTSLVALRNAD